MAEFQVKSASEIRDDILRTYRLGLIRAGISNPVVAPGSDIYILAQAVANQLEVAMANCQAEVERLMPDSADDNGLQKWLDLFDIQKRKPAGSTGSIVFKTSTATYVSNEMQLLDQLGHTYEVTVGGYYSDGDIIPIKAIDTGTETNHNEGDTLRWINPPAFAAPTATVSSEELTGGIDEETTETVRQRLFDKIRTPPSAGNWSHAAELAESTSYSIQKAFVYPCVNGPASLAISVVGYATDVSKTRSIDAQILKNVIRPTFGGLYPEHVDAIITSPTNVPVDICLALTLPSSPSASPPGPGGGWTDGTPWPRVTTANLGNPLETKPVAEVTSVTSSTVFSVVSPTSPVAGITQICWLSPTDWQTYSARVTSFTSNASGTTHTITIDKPFPNIAPGCFISPNAVNAAAYFQAVLDHFAMMGPGEMIQNSAPMYYRAYRHPTPSHSWPYRVDAYMLRAVSNSAQEVLDTDFLYRTYGGNAPTVPLDVTSPASIYIPNNIAFYEPMT